jgi:hypothetical protein
MAKAARNRVMRKVMNAAAAPVLKAMKAKAPTKRAQPVAGYRGGQTKKSLGKKVKTYPTGTTVAIVGPRFGFRTTVGGRAHDPRMIAHLIDRGTKHSAGTYFMTRAYQESKAQVASIMETKLREELAKEAAKAAARGGRR